jgi:hypothetical protein
VFDFRYHALSLVAVFLALGIGIVLGSSLGDSLVSEANRDVRGSLRDDVIQARESARTAAAAAENRDDFISASFDRLAGGALKGERVAIVASGGLPEEVEADVRETVTDAGGTVDSVSRVDAAPDLPDLADKLGGRFDALGSDDAALRPLSRRFAAALVHGGAVGRKLKAAYPDQFTGDFEGADAVVYYRAGIDRDQESQRFESAMIEGLRAAGGPAVGVEAASTDPSQISFYDNAGLSTVDNVDQPAGHAALALALAGARGNFGFKDTADSPLPAASAPGGG